MITKDIVVELFDECQLWWRGPHCLCQNKEHWPEFPSLIDAVPEVQQIKLV